MLVTLSGISMLVRFLQPMNACDSIIEPPVIITSFKLVGTYCLLAEYEDAPNIYPKYVAPLPSAFSPINGKVILVKEPHPRKAPSPIEVTLSGMTILVKELHP